MVRRIRFGLMIAGLAVSALCVSAEDSVTEATWIERVFVGLWQLAGKAGAVIINGG